MASDESKSESDLNSSAVPVTCLALDFDGTLCDSETIWPEVEEETYTKMLNRPWKTESARFLGLTFPDVHEVLQKEYGLEMSFDAFMATVPETMAKKVFSKAPMMSGAEEFLRKAAARRIPMAIATSSHKAWVDQVLVRYKLNDLFVGVSSSESLGPGEGKPNPLVYTKALGMLKSAAASCAAVEDSLNGVLAAKNAGIRCIGFLPHATKEDLASILSFKQGNADELSTAPLCVRIGVAADAVCATWPEVESVLKKWGCVL